MITNFKIFESSSNDIVIDLDDEFKCISNINDDTYFFHARYENKIFPKNIRYGWHISFGILNDKKYLITNKNIPFKVLNFVSNCYKTFLLKYKPIKISFIVEGEKKARIYLNYLVSTNDTINKKDSNLDSYSDDKPILYMIDKTY